MKYSDKLVARYKREIELSWTKLWVNGSFDTVQQDECGEVYECAWLGTVPAVMPSGKVYAQWTTNQTVRDIIHDKAYSEALEMVAEERCYCVVYDDDSIFINNFLGHVTEQYVTYDGGDTFHYDESRFQAGAVRVNMEVEGYFPSILESYDDGCTFSYHTMEE